MPVKNWSETLFSAAPKKARRLGSSREISQARAWIDKLRYDRISLKMVLPGSTALRTKALALASRSVLMGGVLRPAALAAPLHARWSLPHSDWSSSA